MSRYIDADALIRKIQEGHKFGSLTITELISECPTADVVEVVRCKDCKYEDTCCRMIRNEKKPSDYCSYGERREDELHK